MAGVFTLYVLQAAEVVIAAAAVAVVATTTAVSYTHLTLPTSYAV